MDLNSRILGKLKYIYSRMFASKISDAKELELVNSGEANFLASSRGHEGSAILATFLKPSDWLHCHYRDKALMLARGMPSEQFFYSALCKAESHSAGRQMVSHMSSREHNIMSIVGPVGNNALQAVGVAKAIKKEKNSPLVVCSFGDGTSQQGEVLEAIAEAKRDNAPVLFFIHNNELAISTNTKNQTFFSMNNGKLEDSFYNIPITYLDGMNPFKHYDDIKNVVSSIRSTCQPAIIISNFERIDNHSNADDQKLYRTDKEINISISKDSIISSRKFLEDLNISKEEIECIENSAIKETEIALEKARNGTQPETSFTAISPLPKHLMPTAPESRGSFNNNEKRLTMLEAFKQVFNNHLKANENVYLYGQDIEDGKGDVFGTTKGLSTKFPNRVKNSCLSESTIMGSSIGMALAGKKPVAFLQFADFAPVAYNQIASEMATMYWRTNGSWQCPVIVFMACGGYRPGLGPFHSQTGDGVFSSIPGIDVIMPSNASDAAGLLNAAFESNRPTMFLYPKKLLNSQSLENTVDTDIKNKIIPIGKARIDRVGKDITFIGWGNTISICQEVAKSLDKISIDSEIIDLRTIKPLDEKTIIQSVSKTKHLVVVHEDSQTSGVGSEILALVGEKINESIKVRRITRGDTYIPCNFENHSNVLPSFERVLENACEILNIDLKWENNSLDNENTCVVDVIGASPSDEEVLITELSVKIGDSVNAGDNLVHIEASKSAGEILSPMNGIVKDIFVKENAKAEVGTALLTLEIEKNAKNNQQKAQKRIPTLIRKEITVQSTLSKTTEIGKVSLSKPAFKLGSQKITNSDLLKKFPEHTNEDIVTRTGIENRYWLNKDESIIEYSTDVATQALQQNNLTLQDIDLIICTTSAYNKYSSPSIACRVLENLYSKYGKHYIPAYDINAACSGYIYALQSAKDYLSTRPNHKVLIITSEKLSSNVNKNDFDTAFLFGDATTATIAFGQNFFNKGTVELEDTLLASIADNGDTLNIPTDNTGIFINGKKVFTLAVKTMSNLVLEACARNNLTLNDIHHVVPHQANLRISQAIQKKLKIADGVVFNNISNYGNTSSSTIPIALAEILDKINSKESIALCAFGAGLTAGSSLLRKL